jgi:hypothetical protein
MGGLTRGTGTLGWIALAFGLASFQVLGEWNPFNVSNLLLGGILCAVGGIAAFKRLSLGSSAADRGPTLDALLMAIALIWGAVLVQLAIALWGPRFDWTFERRFDLAPATVQALQQLGGQSPIELTLYSVSGDPRRRATRLLLEQIAAEHPSATSSERDLDSSPEEEDYYGIGSSNSVIVSHDGRFELVERPTEGSLYEALSRLRDPTRKLIYVAAGTGEGDLARSEDMGFSGLRAALETEGYELRPFPTAARPQVPGDADGLLVIAPRRRLTDAALAGLRAYLNERGGRLVAFLEPGTESGLEEVLADFGLISPDALVIDPTSSAVEGDAPGLDPIVNAYGDNPVSRGLNANRMTFFRRARSFSLRKPEPDDKITGAVYSSADAWLFEDSSQAKRRTAPERPADARGDYRPIVVAGRYTRGGKQVRIVAFGDSTFASNRYLRALYNLDLVVNAVHWALEREPEITIRPKTGGLLQFAVPVQSALNALYGVGLLVPELIVMVGAWVWLRRRSA